MEQVELAWLAGLLEGEGSFIKGTPSSPNQPIISIQTTDEDIISKVASMWNVKYHKSKKRKSHWKQPYQCVIRGFRAAEWMRVVYAYMGIRRKLQIDTALKDYIPRRVGDATRKLNDALVKEILNKTDKSITALSKEYSINRTIIREIRNGTRWKHVQR